MKILLEKMRFHAFHGVMPEETIVGGEYEVSIALDTDFSKAMETDDLEGTINYAIVFDLVRQEMHIPSKLIEHVAGRIMKSVKQNFPQVEAIEVRVSKLNPPVNGDMAQATVVVNG
ncbi:MAG: dihydroneopterin aldolase [Paludibacteraceae bacterium]|nr:dihydroneopterin aldolase [Paludibacteraceae bacterium]